MNRLCYALIYPLLVYGSFWTTEEAPKDPYDYGVDVTFPIHHYIQKDSFFKRRYEKWMADCYAAYSKRECDATELARLEMSRDQPRMHYNYTELGFKKMKIPEQMFKEISAFWEENKVKGMLEESWPRGNTYVNAWEVPSYMVSLENKNLRGGYDLKNRIWDQMKPILSEWIGGKELEPTSLYGIRVYKRNAYLATHVDRLPLVTSAILQVAQDVEEPWPVEIYGHDGKAYNVTLEPGEMALYESHTTLHGRPFPLNGNYFANIFVHFKPLEYDELLEKLHKEWEETGRLGGNGTPRKKVISGGKKEYSRSKGGHEHDNHDEETLQRHREALSSKDKTAAVVVDKDNREEEEVDGKTILHAAAAQGDFKLVEKLLSNHNTDMLNSRDENGWQAIHETVRSGSLEILKYLIDMGANINAQTDNGGSVLWWAKQQYPDDHEIVTYLTQMGAVSLEGEPGDDEGEQ